MNTKLVSLLASVAFAVGLAVVGQPNARASQPDSAAVEMAKKPGTVKKGEKPKPKPKKGKGTPGEDKMFNPQPEPPGSDPIKVNPKK